MHVLLRSRMLQSHKMLQHREHKDYQKQTRHVLSEI